MRSLLRRYKRLVFLLIPTLRIKSVAEISARRELKRHLRRLRPGIVLDVGGSDAPYRKDVPHTRYLRLDIDSSSKPDILGDAHEIRWESGHFDTTLAIDVLEHVREPQRVVDEMRRVLKSGGICITSTPFLYPYHPGPEDHYRFTSDSLKHLFREFSHVEIHAFGNRLQVLWQLVNFVTYESPGKAIFTSTIAAFLNVLNLLVARVQFGKTKFPLGFVVYAVK